MRPDLVVHLALLTGQAALVFAGLLVAAAATARAVATARRRRDRRSRAAWTPSLHAAVTGGWLPAPRVARRDAEHVLSLWNHHVELVDGPARAHLAALARAGGFDRRALRLAAARGGSARLAGIRTLGNLGSTGAWSLLAEELTCDGGVMWLAAAEALTRIDPCRAAPLVAARLGARSDWHPAQLTRLISAADETALGTAVVARLDPRSATCPLLLRLLAALLPLGALPTVRRLLDDGPPPEVAAGCLRVLGACRHPTDLERIRGCLADPAEAVRVQAVVALGHYGDPADTERLVALLADRHWWVRYRAAQALAAADPGSHAPVAVGAVTDRYGQQALVHALAEAEG